MTTTMAFEGPGDLRPHSRRADNEASRLGADNAASRPTA